MRATYSPDDNKLRLYSEERLDADTYAAVKAEGFKWAPVQKLFVAPMWTPSRADLLIDLCGTIEDEDTALVDRAEERAERFEDYSYKRADEAQSAREGVEAVAGRIPFGQPILVGHHSEARARRDAQRIDHGMRRAVQLWETAEYWKHRAAGAIRAAKYKERPDVRARRIKGLEADARRFDKQRKDADLFLTIWRKIDEAAKAAEPEGSPTITERAKKVANLDHYSACFTLAEYPREEPASQYEGAMSLWSALDGGIMTGAQAAALAIPHHVANIEDANRWLEHINGRLSYERAMLAEGGGLASDAFNFEVGGRILWRGEWCLIKKVNRKAGAVCSVSVVARYCSVAPVESIRDYRPPTEDEAAKVKAATKLPPLCNYPGEGFRHMTTADWKRNHWSDVSYVTKIEATATTAAHRVRCYPKSSAQSWLSDFVYLTDAKRTEPPAAGLTVPTPKLERKFSDTPQPVYKAPAPDPEAAPFEAMKDAIKEGVSVVVADQLFPTPADLARRMVQVAGCMAGQRILEPSAGTGNLIEAAVNAATGFDCCEVVAIEKSAALVENLKAMRNLWLYANDSNFGIHCGDFLSFTAPLKKFHRVIMNPPFKNGEDIKHIRHAMGFLAPGGRLVALCANGPRQREALQPIAGIWEELPAGSFAEAGTNVNVALFVYDQPAVSCEKCSRRIGGQPVAVN